MNVAIGMNGINFLFSDKSATSGVRFCAYE